MKDCCKKEGIERFGGLGDVGRKKGIFQGIMYGILPHSFCIAFIVFTVIGSTVAVGFFRKFLLTPYFFEILIGLSFLLATISAVVYLRRKDNFSVRGIRENWGYLGILYGTTIAVNLLLFLVIFPIMTNGGGTRGIRGNRGTRETAEIETVFLEVKIPCSGHAPLVGEELKKTAGITDFRFSLPNIFLVEYNPSQITVEQILSLPIFGSFPAEVKDNV